MNDNPFSSGCGFTILRVCVFLPSNMALTIGDENKIGRSRIVSCFVGHRRDEYRHRVRTPRQRGEDLTFRPASEKRQLARVRLRRVRLLRQLQRHAKLPAPRLAALGYRAPHHPLDHRSGRIVGQCRRRHVRMVSHAISSSSTSSLDSTFRCDAGTIRATSSRCARHHSRTR